MFVLRHRKLHGWTSSLILLSSFLFCGTTYSQFKGGNGTGNIVATSSNQSLGRNIFKGGNDDGTTTSLAGNQPLGRNIFKGGSDDGVTMSATSNQPLGRNIFKGGNDDGVTMSLASNQPIGRNIFKGGNDDGVTMSAASNQPIGRNIFKGGNDDGWAMAFAANVLLPVTLTEFNGVWNQNDALLTWKTATEANLSHFDLERSFDAVSFTKVTSVQSPGNSLALKTYSYTDAGIKKSTPAGVHNLYYRLRSVDKNGDATYSGVVILKVTNDNNVQYALFPNPARDYVTITASQFTLTGNNFIRVVDLSGKLLISQKMTSLRQQVSVAALANGAYIVQLFTNDQIVYTKKSSFKNKHQHMKRIMTLAFLLLAGGFTYANNVKISSVSTTVTGGKTVLNFSIQWDNSWRGGPGNNWDAVWVFVKYKGDFGWYQHLDLTGDDITAPASLTVKVPNDHKGCFIYRSADGAGSVTSSTISVGVNQKPGSYDVKVFGLEMVYIPQGPFYLGHSGGNSDNFGEAGTVGTTPFQITSAFPPTIGSSTGYLYDARVVGTGTFNSSWPTGFNAFYIMKYELSQAGYRDFLNASPGYFNNIFPERSDLTSSNYQTVGTRLFPQGYRNNLVIGSASATNPVKANANGNTTYDEADDGEWTAANFLYWSDAAAFLDWAALRPMTEFEYEKAVNGPDALNYPQFASGSYIQVPNISNPGILNPNTSSETVTHTNLSQNYINTNEFWGSATNGSNTGQPLRGGFAADNLSTRLSSGGSFYGVMDLTGNLWEPVVTAANVAGRSFNGNNLGDGSISGLTGQANEPTWPGVQNVTTSSNGAGQILKLNTAGISKRGGSFAENLFYAVTDVNYNPDVVAQAYPTTRAGAKSYGCRGVRQE